MRKLGFFLLAALSACSSRERLPRSAQGTAVIEVRGAVKGGPHALGREDLARLPRLDVRGIDPRTGRAAAWSGTSLVALVSERVELRRGADTVVVRTGDRAAIPIPLGVIRQLRPVLADRRDGVPISPAEVVWPTAEQPGLDTDPRASTWWARDVVVLEIVDWQRTFGPALAPPDGAVDAARRGAGVYAESCISCHRMRGQGGERGPDLSTIGARLERNAFAALLPAHPGWKDRRTRDASAEQTSAEVWAFLRAVATVPAATAPVEATAERAATPPAAPVR